MTQLSDSGNAWMINDTRNVLFVVAIRCRFYKCVRQLLLLWGVSSFGDLLLSSFPVKQKGNPSVIQKS
jgi:hypothetical protein